VYHVVDQRLGCYPAGMTTLPPAVDDRGHALIEAAIELVAAEGLKAATARRIAAEAGASPSVVNYRFGGRDALIAAAFDRARAEDGAWRLNAVEALPPAGLAPPMLAGFLHAAVHADGWDHRRLSRARWECYLAAEVGGDFRDVAVRWVADHEAFWALVLARFGIDARAAAATSEFADGLARLYLGRGSPLVYGAWTNEAAARFVARLVRAGPGAPSRGGWRAAHLAAPPADGVSEGAPPSETVRRALDGAAELLASVGPRGLTHRAVAAATGVSLSSLTYHFAGRADMVRAAYRRLYGAWAARSAPEALPASGATSAADVVERMLRAMIVAGRVAPEPLVHQIVQLEASRDPELGPEMDSLRAGAGPATVALLERVRGIGPVDELDGFCFATWATGVARAARLTGEADREAYLRRRYTEALDLLFGV